MFQFCIRCGHPLKHVVEEGFNRWSCESCGWTFYNNQRPCITGIPIRKNQIMLHRRGIDPGRGTWDVPGGFIEVGETPETALRREIDEELGLKILKAHFMGFYPDAYGLDEIYTLNIVYLCQLEEAPIRGSDEIEEVRWFGWDELPGGYAFDFIHLMLADAAQIKPNW